MTKDVKLQQAKSIDYGIPKPVILTNPTPNPNVSFRQDGTSTPLEFVPLLGSQSPVPNAGDTVCAAMQCGAMSAFGCERMRGVKQAT